MKILITGAGGFIGKNLVSALRTRGYGELLLYDADSLEAALERHCAACEFVYHLAGVSRSRTQDELMQGNYSLTDTLLRTLLRYKNRSPVMFASSTQAALPNLYGRSKKAAEELLDQYQRETGAKTYVYRLPSVFGKWSRPNGGSSIATFCYNAAHDLPITVDDPNAALHLAYIDDVVEALLGLLSGVSIREGPYCVVPVTHTATAGDIAARVESFRRMRAENVVPDLTDPFTRKLYATYTSFLPPMAFAYPLQQREDERGSFTEFLRSKSAGQVSVSVTHPGAVRGNHYHHTKAEKFLVVSGTGVIRFRGADEAESVEYRVSGKKPVVVDIPSGCAHSIENVGKTDLVTILWASECFDPEKPDTIASQVAES